MKKTIFIFIIVISVVLISCGRKEITLPDTQVSVDFDREKGQHIVVLNGERYVELTEEPNQYWQIDSEADFHYVGTVERNKDKYDIALTEDGIAMDYYNAEWLIFEKAEWYLLKEGFELPDFSPDKVSQIEVSQNIGNEQILKTVEGFEQKKGVMNGFQNAENNIIMEDYFQANDAGQVGVFGDIVFKSKDYEWLQLYCRIYVIGENFYFGMNDGSDTFVYISKDAIAEIFDIPISELKPEDYWEPLED